MAVGTDAAGKARTHVVLDRRTVTAVLDAHPTSIDVVVGGEETEGFVGCDCGWDKTLWTVEGECECFYALDDEDFLTECTCEVGRLCIEAELGTEELSVDAIRSHLADELARLTEVSEAVVFAALEGRSIESSSESIDVDALTAAILTLRRHPDSWTVNASAERLADVRAQLDSLDSQSVMKTAPDNPMSEPIYAFDLAALDEAITSRLGEWTDSRKADADGLGAVTLLRPGNSSIDAMTVKSGRKGVGRLLLESGVVIVNDESLRGAITSAVEAAGFDVRRSIVDREDAMFNGDVKAIGAWGNVIGFEVEAGVLVALVDLDTDELFTISRVLEPALLSRLHRMGVEISTVHPPSPTYKRLDECVDRYEMLHSRLTWHYPYERVDRLEVEPRYAVPADAPLRVSAQVAQELPVEMVRAFEEQLRGEIFDRTPIREGRGPQYWEKSNGVLDVDDVAAYRFAAPIGVELPRGWRDWWDMAVEISVPHAPTVCGLFLQSQCEQWWYELPLERLIEGGTWLVGHSGAQPEWLRRDHSRDEERRLQAAVSLVLNAVEVLPDFRLESRHEVGCLLCGRRYEKGMLQAGDVFRRLTSDACDRCAATEWPTTARDLTDVQRDGIYAALRWYCTQAGRVIGKREYTDGLDLLGASPEACLVMDRWLPTFVLQEWNKWFSASGAEAAGFMSATAVDSSSQIEEL